jgi:phage head maturation protease
MSGTDNYIIEFTQIGGSVKVTAVDPKTMTEVSIVGSPQYSQEFLTRQAVKKLEYMLAKKRDEGA